MDLRPYQAEAVEAVYRHLREKDNNPCNVLPTGTGKSVVIAKIVSDSVQNWHGRVLILAHVKELLEQNSGKVKAFCPDIPMGIFSAGLKSRDTDEPVIVAGIQSVYNKACDLGAFDLIIVDKCTLYTLRFACTHRQEEHITLAEKLFCATHIKNCTAVYLA